MFRNLLQFLLLAVILPLYGQTYNLHSNLVYKVSANQPQLLDVYYPKTPPPPAGFPLMIMIHGGAWVEGTKNMKEYYKQRLSEELPKRGIALASISYRLTNDSTFIDACLTDSRDAVRWLRKNADSLRLDGKNFGLWGDSAGGHLALMVANSPEDLVKGEAALSDVSSKVNYVIDNFGPTDLNALFKTDAGSFVTFLFKIFKPKLYKIRSELLYPLTGYHWVSDKEGVINTLRKFSPVIYLNEKSPPTLITQGTKDEVVPFVMSKDFYTLLKSKNIPADFIPVENGKHEYPNIDKSVIDELVRKNIEFIESHYKVEPKFIR